MNSHPVFLARAAHFCLAAIPGTFGLILLAPGDTFSSSHTYHWFALLATEAHWGWALAFVSAFGFAGLAAGHWPRLRFATLVFLGTVHWLVALLFILGSWHSTGTGTYAWVAVLSWLVAWDSRHGAD